MLARRPNGATMVQIKRIYDEPNPGDGYRVLIDRIWPRGVSKEAAQLDAWMKDIAPSPDLRVWFGHAPARWHEFKFQYQSQLRGRPQQACIEALRERQVEGPVTLLFAAKDPHHNHALVLLDFLRSKGD